MFSQCYQIGESIELFNSQDKKLFSKWGFTGKHSKVYDPNLRNYEMVLSSGNLSKMEIPKNSFNNKNKSLSLFQSYVVFQLYLFSSKQLTIEIAISDTLNTKRRLIFSSNNSDLVINQLHCRIPIFKFPIGRWVNFSIDILSFVSKCYKNLTFRSVDYISLSMNGKVRYIFTMRTPLIEINSSFELDEEGNIINYNNNNLDLDDNDYNEDNSKIGDNSENNSFAFGAKDIPDKFKFPPHHEVINMNIDCKKVFSQIYIENENKKIMLSQNRLYNKNPILIQDTANAINMDKGLNFRHQVYMKQKKTDNNIYDYYDDNQISTKYVTRNINKNINNNLKKSSKIATYNMKGNRFNNVGNLIMSQNLNNNIMNKKYTYNFDRNNLKLNMNMNSDNFENMNYNNNDINKNELDNDKEFINISKPYNNNEKYDNLFNKEEYNKLYSKGQGVTAQIKKNLKINKENNVDNIDFDDKMNYDLSEIKNDMNINNNFDYNNIEFEGETIENDKNCKEKNNGRPFSPPITKLEEGEYEKIYD